MGSFSFISAPINNQEKTIKNIWCNDYVTWGVSKEDSKNASFIMYIPQDFGGGFIFDKSYQDYGKINDFDIYALYYYMNKEPKIFKEIISQYKKNNSIHHKYDENTRNKGIALFYSENIYSLKKEKVEINKFIQVINKNIEKIEEFENFGNFDSISEAKNFIIKCPEVKTINTIKNILFERIDDINNILISRKNEKKYPLKLRQVDSKEINYNLTDFNLTYEQIEYTSVPDENQGFFAVKYKIYFNNKNDNFKIIDETEL